MWKLLGAVMATLKGDTARQVSEALLACSGELNASIRLVLERCPGELAGLYRTLAGDVMGRLFTDVLRPLYRAHPDLEPKELKNPSSEEDGARHGLPPELSAQLLELAASTEARFRTLVDNVRNTEGESVEEGLSRALRSSRESLQTLREFVRRASMSEA